MAASSLCLRSQVSPGFAGAAVRHPSGEPGTALTGKVSFLRLQDRADNGRTGQQKAGLRRPASLRLLQIRARSSHHARLPGPAFPFHGGLQHNILGKDLLARRGKRGQTVAGVASGEGGSIAASVESQPPEGSPPSTSRAADVETGADVQQPPLSRGVLIWRAVKLPIYSVALIPILVGGAAAYYSTGAFVAERFWTMLGSSCLVIAWLNLSNDYYDSETGVDANKPESVVNLMGSRGGVLVAALSCLALGLGGIFRVASAIRDTRVAVLLAAAIACGYVYQCPPFRLSYKGLGEPLCFLAFGPLATSAFYLTQAAASVPPGGPLPPVSPAALAASVLVGITTTVILFCSHFHQIDDDRAVGKMSPLVRLGTTRGATVVQTAVLALYGVSGVMGAIGVLPLSCLLASALTAPIGSLVMNFVNENHTNKVVIFMAKYFAVRLHIAHGLLTALALAVPRWYPLPPLW